MAEHCRKLEGDGVFLGVSLAVTSNRVFDVDVARCRFPLAPFLPPLVPGVKRDALVALVALRLPRRRAYSALACSATSLVTARLSASPRMRGLL